MGDKIWLAVAVAVERDWRCKNLGLGRACFGDLEGRYAGLIRVRMDESGGVAVLPNGRDSFIGIGSGFAIDLVPPASTA